MPVGVPSVCADLKPLVTDTRFERVTFRTESDALPLRQSVEGVACYRGTRALVTTHRRHSPDSRIWIASFVFSTPCNVWLMKLVDRQLAARMCLSTRRDVRPVGVPSGHFIL